MQRIEAERAKRRQLANLKNQDVVPLNPKEREGESLDAVAESLGISRDRWYKLRKIFTKAEEGDEEAQELLKAAATGRPFPLADYLGKLGVL